MDFELDAESIIVKAVSTGHATKALAVKHLDAVNGRDYEHANDVALKDWLCIEGDTKAFEEIFQRYGERVAAYAARYINSVDLAKDVCQEVFLKFIAKPPSVLMYDNLGPWLFRVTRNLAIDKRRRRKFEVPGEEEISSAKEEENPLKTLTAQNDAVVVRALVDKLPPEIREVVNLRMFSGMAFKDVAVTLGIPQGTALWRMHRALELLRIEWKKL